MSLRENVVLSLEALFCFLNRPRAARRTVCGLLLIHTILLAYSAYVHSPTLNEPAHLVAGLSHWKFGRFDLYRVNPPLVRMVAALPVLAVGYNEDWSGFYEGPGVRPVFGMGEHFVAANGKRSFYLLMIGRWACIPFSWIGAISCYLWARDLYGRSAGVIACMLWCFSPNILAHASLITADVGGTGLGVAACYTFWRWLRLRTWSQAALTGIVLGLAELSKTTLILFYPLWPMLWVFYRLQDRSEMRPCDWIQESGMLMLRMTIGIYVLNLGYGFEDSFEPLNEFHFVSELFSGQEASNGIQESLGTATSNSKLKKRESANRFSSTPLANFPALFPKNYLLGIDIQQRDFENYGRQSYLRGRWQDQGWWYYYLYAGLIKVPLGTLILGGITLILRLNGQMPGSEQFRDTLLLLAPPLAIFGVCSAKTGFSEHFRYVLPCFPFLFIWISSLSNKLGISGTRGRFLDSYKSDSILMDAEVLRTNSKYMPLALGFLFLWPTTSSLCIYPHSLSYFNESIGGPLNGPKHLLGSNVDWGQDLRYAESARCALANSRTRIVYHGYFNPVSARSSCYERTQLLDKSPEVGEVVFISRNALAGRSALIYPSLDPLILAILREAELVRGPITYSGYSIVGIEYSEEFLD